MNMTYNKGAEFPSLQDRLTSTNIEKYLGGSRALGVSLRQGFVREQDTARPKNFHGNSNLSRFYHLNISRNQIRQYLYSRPSVSTEGFYPVISFCSFPSFRRPKVFASRCLTSRPCALRGLG
jgi:hypothetical protein